MSKKEIEIERLKTKPKDFTYDETKTLLNKLGLIENNKGKTSGSDINGRFKNCINHIQEMF